MNSSDHKDPIKTLHDTQTSSSSVQFDARKPSYSTNLIRKRDMNLLKAKPCLTSMSMPSNAKYLSAFNSSLNKSILYNNIGYSFDESIRNFKKKFDKAVNSTSTPTNSLTDIANKPSSYFPSINNNQLKTIHHNTYTKVNITKYVKDVASSRNKSSMNMKTDDVTLPTIITSANISEQPKKALGASTIVTLDLTSAKADFIKKKEFMNEYFHKNDKFLNRTNKKTVRMLLHQNLQFSNDEEVVLNENDEDQYQMIASYRPTTKQKMRKALMVVLAIVKMKWSKKPELQFINKPEIKIDQAIFNIDLFKRQQEIVLVNDVKYMLASMKPHERTNDIIKYILFFLNFTIPEFSDFPIYIQRKMAALGFYEEFGPERVIIREGHHAQKYYFICSGSANLIKASEVEKSSGEVNFKILRVLKKGDAFGELGIINKTKRSATIMSNGEKPLGLLAFDRESFFLIQNQPSSKASQFEFLKSKVEIFQKLDFPFDRLHHVTDDFFSLYYRKNQLICGDSLNDNWLYAIKSGSAKVMKKVKLSFEKFVEIYKENRLRNSLAPPSGLNVLETTNPTVEHEEKEMRRTYQYLFEKYSYEEPPPSDDDQERYVFLEVTEIGEGYLFGLQDLIMKDDLLANQQTNMTCDPNVLSYILVSEGVECVLINRINFMKHLPSQSYLKIRYFVQLFPTDDYFINKYFNKFKWLDYKERCQSQIGCKSKSAERNS